MRASVLIVFTRMKPFQSDLILPFDLKSLLQLVKFFSANIFGKICQRKEGTSVGHWDISQ